MYETPYFFSWILSHSFIALLINIVVILFMKKVILKLFINLKKCVFTRKKNVICEDTQKCTYHI
ncbi:hypothetical protein DRO38_07800 [Candidatus Bathyarchaeota archaeon]|nr:MAG: hypothetical protein DRO38_07800 [Candidatus Bathyarchaeota archaeon]